MDHVPPVYRQLSAVNSIRDWGEAIIDVAASHAPVVKLQYAHYAALGLAGKDVLRELISYAKVAGLLVILDFKRTDIGDTMEHYCSEALQYAPDACTLGSPYFGPTFWPGWKPWLAEGRMVIQMVRTSNKNSLEDDMQMWELADGRHVYERVAQRVAAWHEQVAIETDGMGAVGAVVGATQTSEAERCRELLGGEVFTLKPGYGAQGGKADGAVAGLFNSRGEPMGTVNSSRDTTWQSWFDREGKKPREGDPLDFVKTAINAANTELNAASAAARATNH